MSLKKLLGLNQAGISEFEVMGKLNDAVAHDLDEVDFIAEDGSVIRVKLPHINHDPMMDTNY